MALVVEDGTGLAGAEAFVSVADADTRHSNFGNTAWASASTEEREQALRKATAYMEQAYRSKWKGTKLLRAQALSWPRYGATVDGYTIDSTLVPDEVANACADLALRALSDDLNADQTRAVVREKVGPLETEYSEASPQGTRYRAVDMALGPFLRFGSMNTTLVRA